MEQRIGSGGCIIEYKAKRHKLYLINTRLSKLTVDRFLYGIKAYFNFKTNYIAQ